MRKKPIAMLLTWTLILAVFLSGCSNSGSDGEGEASGSGSDGKVTLKFMHLWPAGSSAQQNKLVNEIIKQYQTDHPNVTIKQEVLENEQYKNKLKILSASNELPDVGVTWAAGFLEPYVKGNLFAPLDDLLSGSLEGKFIAGTTEAYAVDGKTYALPIELNISPIYYNKDIFSKYNLQPPATYDEFLNVVKTLTDNGVVPIALGNKDRWTGSLWYMYLANRLGGDALEKAINGTGKFDDPALIQAAAEVQKLVDMNAFNKGYNGLSNDEGKSEFMNEKAAMYLMGTWELPNYTTNPDVPQEFKDKIGFFKFPTMDGGKSDINSWVGGPGVGLFVAQNSKVKDEAQKFVQYFVEKWGDSSVTEAGVIPATKVDTAEVKLPQLYTDLLNELNQASSLTLFADVQMKPTAAQVHLDMIQALFGKAVTPEEFVKKHQEAIDKGN
ncbi:extracellular solute-binding protein [Paenibacillus sp. OK003]|uniref:extracellular solute-binding protein n=1 Tax=Paenibacillus sp. OK003 TaxID=1884380 RepID=UPI0008D1EA55|nr:extracellular solute-binding protein [Paenibacillus sp. OK003]SEK46125.1 raffinose/stachyose/melibiose transport system substrate-binding protein [Paenibacillus sp. OK003]